MKRQLQSLWTNGDHSMSFLFLILVGWGLLMIRSATLGTRFSPMAGKQALWAVLSTGIYLLALIIPYETWLEYAYLIYGASVVSLVFVLLIGHRVAGARSWITLGPVGFQPSEFAKVAAIMACAAYLKSVSGRRAGLREAFIMALMVCVPAALTFLQPDLGTTATFLPILLVPFYLSKAKLSTLLKWAFAGLCLLLVMFAIGWFSFFKPYQKDRILTFMNPSFDPRGAGYQLQQSTIAVGSGEITGKGLYSGTQNRLSFLPAAHTDFIFSVIAEETGFVGSLSLLTIFLLLLSRFLNAARLSRDAEGRFIAVAALSLILCHLLINVGMVLGLLPTTGIPLPFISYGGSFLLSMSFLTGLVGNVYARRFVE